MKNIDRSTDDETDSEDLEVGKGDAVIGADDQVRFIDTLDAETRAQVDEVLELSVKLAHDLMVALYRR
ncbi:MAG TPA: hypothetical protein VK575_02655 [Gemmatimonadaceae bacterium]|nr:hypothetical protein [Gemmatimonadaceae bacterium]